jgi:hypothetical protein
MIKYIDYNKLQTGLLVFAFIKNIYNIYKVKTIKSKNKINKVKYNSILIFSKLISF